MTKILHVLRIAQVASGSGNFSASPETWSGSDSDHTLVCEMTHLPAVTSEGATHLPSPR